MVIFETVYRNPYIKVGQQSLVSNLHHQPAPEHTTQIHKNTDAWWEKAEDKPFTKKNKKHQTKTELSIWSKDIYSKWFMK